ncbi:MAG: SGNH/GDSL hydrolase family protein [Bacteroidota bacterium]
MSKRNALFSLLFLLLIAISCLVTAELAVRVLGEKPYGTTETIPPHDTALKDDVLGWKMTPNYTFDGIMWGTGVDRPVSLRYDENGFKAYGNPKGERPKVFFIGDSYTASVEVSNDSSFFNLIGDSLDIEVFAYGHAGYGTLQQLLILEQYIPIIQPDLVVWQNCTNDFKDNCAALERISYYNVKQRRPYLDADGKVVYIRPVSAWYVLGEYSAFVRFIHDRWRGYRQRNYAHEIGENRVQAQGRSFDLYQQSIDRTTLTLERYLAGVGKAVPTIGFVADDYKPESEDMSAIFASVGIPYTSAPIDALGTAKQRGEKVHSGDGFHWKENGHRIVAASLLPFIAKQLVSDKEPILGD